MQVKQVGLLWGKLAIPNETRKGLAEIIAVNPLFLFGARGRN